MTGVLCAATGQPDRWFSEATPGTTAHAVDTLFARRTCFACPAKAACLDLAMADHRTTGIFAGLDEVERRRLHRDGATPDSYGYCGGGVHLMTPENTGAKGGCLPCRRISRAERAERTSIAVPYRRRGNGRFAETAELALEAAA